MVGVGSSRIRNFYFLSSHGQSLLPSSVMKLRTYDEKKKKKVFVGTLEGDTFIVKKGTKHYMVKEQGYGIQQDVLGDLASAGCKNIVLETKTKTIRTKLQDWIKHGTVKNYGHGNQVFLKKKIYEKTL